MRGRTADNHRVSKCRVKAWSRGRAFYAAIVSCSATGRSKLMFAVGETRRGEIPINFWLLILEPRKTWKH